MGSYSAPYTGVTVPLINYVGLPFIDVSLAPYFCLDDNSTANDTPLAAVVTAINAAGGGTVYFPRKSTTGIYKITGTQGLIFTVGNVTITSDPGVVLSAPLIAANGAAGTGGSGTNAAMQFTGTHNLAVGTTIAASIAQGAEAVVVSSASGYSANQWCVVRSNGGSGVGEVYNYDRSGQYIKGEWAQIKSISGTTITFWSPLRDSYSNTYTISVDRYTLIENIRVENLTFQLGGTPNADPASATSLVQVGLRFSDVRHVTVENVTIKNAEKYGLLVFCGVDITINNCNIIESNESGIGYGIRGTGVDNMTITNCHFEKNRHSIDNDSYRTNSTSQYPISRSWVVRGNQFKHDWGAAISSHGADEGWVVDGNIITGCGGGIVLRGRDNTISNNKIFGKHNNSESYNHGIYIGDGTSGGGSPYTSRQGLGLGGTRLKIVNNTIDLFSKQTGDIAHGIYITPGCVDAIISGNTIRNHTGHGIWLNGYVNSDTKIEDNTIDGVRVVAGTYYGIYLYPDQNVTALAGSGADQYWPASVGQTLDGRSSTGIRIRNNTFRSARTAAVYINGNSVGGANVSNDIDIDDNYFLSYTTNAIHLASGFFGGRVNIDNNKAPAGTTSNFMVALTMSAWASGTPGMSGNTIAGVTYVNDGVWRPVDSGLLAWNYDPMMATGTATLSGTGVINILKVPWPKTATITSLRYSYATAGGTLTSGQSFIGVYDDTGQRIAVSAAQDVIWVGATGVQNTAMVAAAKADGGPGRHVYVAFLAVGTTMPTFHRMTALAALQNVGQTAPYRFGTILTGQTSLPSSLTLANVASANGTFWVGVS